MFGRTERMSTWRRSIQMSLLGPMATRMLAFSCLTAVAASGLLAISYAERQRLLSRAVEIGGGAFAEHSLLSSLFNAVCATGAAYAFGLLLRVI